MTVITSRSLKPMPILSVVQSDVKNLVAQTLQRSKINQAESRVDSTS